MNKHEFDNVYCMDVIYFCDKFAREYGQFVDLTVTSPPYNVGINYGSYDDSAMAYNSYIDWLNEVWKSIYRVHKDHTYIAVNIGRNTQYNTPAHIAIGLEKAGFKFYKSIQWVKPQGAAVQTCWYKYPYPRYYEPYLVTEDILIYSKGEVTGEYRGEKVDILDDDFIRSVASNVWEIQPDGSKVQKGIHPAPFPIELPSRLIQLLSLPGDTVYDPFCGSGTTLEAAQRLGRFPIGTDIDERYCEISRKALEVKSLF